MSEPNDSQTKARTIYVEWRKSLSYGKHSYQDIAASIDEAIVRCQQEIPHAGVRDSVIEQWKFMQSRVSEFTADGEVEADDFPECLADPIKYSGSCYHCGRPIADYETKFKIIGPRRGNYWCCIDCNLKGL